MKKYCAIAALLVGLIEAIDSRGQICRLAPDQRGYRQVKHYFKWTVWRPHIQVELNSLRRIVSGLVNRP
jgi:hypothetical protein